MLVNMNVYLLGQIMNKYKKILKNKNVNYNLMVNCILLLMVP